PDAYRKVYDEIAGLPPQDGAERVLADFAVDLAAVSDVVAPLSAQLAQAVQRKDWNACAQTLSALVEQHLRPAVRPAPAPAPAPEPAPPPTQRARSFPLVETTAPLAPVLGQEGALRDLLARALDLGIAPM